MRRKSGFTLISEACKGFTLIEVLVAMTIVAVLMGLALVSYQGARKSARDGRRKADLEQVRSALEMCRADSGRYPPQATLSSGDAITCGAITYMTIPSDPLADRKYSYAGGAAAYVLCAALEVGGIPNSCGTVDCGLGVAKLCDYKTANP